LALNFLREVLSPILSLPLPGSETDRKKLSDLTNFLIYSTAEKVYEFSNWDGAHGKSRELLAEKLKHLLPANVFFREKRLLRLLDQASSLC
jgi:hypothetical protein